MSFWKVRITPKKRMKLIGFLLIIVTLGLMNQMLYSSNFYCSVKKDHENQTVTRITNITHGKRQIILNENWKDKIKVLCWVMTQPKFHDKRAIHVKNTWGKRCDKLLFISSINDVRLPSIGLVVSDSYNMIWGKTKAAFKYVYEHYLNDYTWFMKADDDTYVVMENLRFLLRMYDPDNDAIYLGHKNNPSPTFGYHDGGGGYVLSRKALKLLIEKALPNSTLCRQDDNTFMEDLEMAICLSNVGVITRDTKDRQNRGTFFHYDAGTYLMPGRLPVGQRSYPYNIMNGSDCCSDLAISFHWVEPIMMYEMDYLLYHLHPHGITYSDPNLPSLLPNNYSIPQRQVIQRKRNNLGMNLKNNKILKNPE